MRGFSWVLQVAYPYLRAGKYLSYLVYRQGCTDHWEYSGAAHRLEPTRQRLARYGKRFNFWRQLTRNRRFL